MSLIGEKLGIGIGMRNGKYELLIRDKMEGNHMEGLKKHLSNIEAYEPQSDAEKTQKQDLIKAVKTVLDRLEVEKKVKRNLKNRRHRLARKIATKNNSI